MTTDALLRQILADPTDAALRSVYADALMAAGDPRGELIAIECAPPTPEGMRRRAELRAEHAKRWWGLPAHCVRTRGGFVEGIAGTVEELEAAAPVFAREPVTDVEVTIERHDSNVLGHAPWLESVRRLAVRRMLLRQDLAALCRQPLGARLESLDATGAMPHVFALEAALPRCRRLVLAHCPLGRTLTTLLRWHHLNQLEELDVRSCGLDAWALDDLLALDLAALRVLKLSGNPLGDRGTQVLQQRLRHLPRLEHLELVECDVTDITHAAITEREDLPATLELCGTTIELIRTRPDQFGVLVDGVRRTVRFCQRLSERGDPSWTSGPSSPMDEAPLAPLYRALALGASRYHTPLGARMRLSYDVSHVYTAVYTAIEDVELELTDEAVGIALERHTEIEEG